MWAWLTSDTEERPAAEKLYYYGLFQGLCGANFHRPESAPLNIKCRNVGTSFALDVTGDNGSTGGRQSLRILAGILAIAATI
jgi:hypothetical protein